ncbi:MAG: Mu-like prophage major head subunit gpT family protein [bacterium]|nr:Mu-like prophage major head subunit gpT family protein [bacterium]
MGTPITRDQLSDLTALETALRAVFMEQVQIEAEGGLLRSLYNVQQSSRAVERNMGISGLGDVPEYRGTLEYDSFDALYTTSYQHREYALGMSVERALMDDDEYNVIRRRAAMLGLSFDRTVERQAASTFNLAFSATQPGADGKPLCATDHPLAPTSSAAQSNKGTSALTHDALIATKEAMMKLTDSRGNPLPLMPDTLLVPVELEAEALVIVQSTLKSGGNSNDANVNTGYRVLSNRFLSDANNWFLIDSRMAQLYLNWYWRVRPEFTTDAAGEYSLVYRFRGYGRWSFGWDSPWWIYGHEVS